MAAIKHLIVLMMENRSFDHMLGFMKAPKYPIEGLDGNETNPTPSGEGTVTVTSNANYAGDLTTDPSHDFEDVIEQMYGTRQPALHQTPNMLGFVQNYARFTHDDDRAARIMRCFDPARLPVITTLAREYAVCDHWHASVPGPTLPNRAFAHAGTSRGRLDLSPDFLGGFQTIYEVLWRNKVESTIFYHDWSSALTFEFLLLHHQGLFFTPFNRFAELCRKNKLPSYCFIEPRYSPEENGGAFLPANDQHPDHDVAVGEHLIQSVYEAVRLNDNVWKSTMLVIVYDEHGGLFDHVPPPACLSPDGMICISPPFDFRRLGPRVPAVVVSPYIQRGTISPTVYDHTSFLATAMKLFVPKKWPSDDLGQRTKTAATLDDLLDLNASPRMDTPSFTAAAGAKKAGAMKPGLKMAAKKAVLKTDILMSSLQRKAVEHAAILESRLPPHQQTGIPVAQLKTEIEASRYLKAVNAKLQAQRPGVGKS